MSHVIVVQPKNSDAVPQTKTYYFFGYVSGLIQTTDRVAKAAVVADKDLSHLLESLQLKSDHKFKAVLSDRRPTWTMQRLRMPKPRVAKHKKVQRAQHYPKIKRVRPTELAKRFEEFCQTA